VKLTVWQNLDLVARQITPVLLTLITVILARLPMHVPYLGPVMPWLTLVAVFYWAAHRPDLMPGPAVFAVGLFHDLLSGAPLGVGIIVLLLVHAAIAGQRRFFVSRSFSVLWAVFAIVALVAMALHWGLTMVATGALLSPEPVVFQVLTTIAVYPLLTWVFAHVQRTVLR
jgi:rod shape-determining protein MreD